jgi:hypothetical protein
VARMWQMAKGSHRGRIGEPFIGPLLSQEMTLDYSLSCRWRRATLVVTLYSKSAEASRAAKLTVGVVIWLLVLGYIPRAEDVMPTQNESICLQTVPQ